MKQRMLLIEDNEQNRYLTTFLLQVRGWEVVPAVDGPTGLLLADTMQPPPVLILLDIQLPGMDGYEVAERLRANPALAGIPVIAVTSYAMPGVRLPRLSGEAD